MPLGPCRASPGRARLERIAPAPVGLAGLWLGWLASGFRLAFGFRLDFGWLSAGFRLAFGLISALDFGFGFRLDFGWFDLDSA